MKTKNEIMGIVCWNYNCSDSDMKQYPLCDMYPKKCPGYLLSEKMVETFISKSVIKDKIKEYCEQQENTDSYLDLYIYLETEDKFKSVLGDI